MLFQIITLSSSVFFSRTLPVRTKIFPVFVSQGHVVWKTAKRLPSNMLSIWRTPFPSVVTEFLSDTWNTVIVVSKSVVLFIFIGTLPYPQLLNVILRWGIINHDNNFIYLSCSLLHERSKCVYNERRFREEKESTKYLAWCLREFTSLHFWWMTSKLQDESFLDKHLESQSLF